MPKKIKYESAVFLFLAEAKKIAEECKSFSNSEYNKWKNFVESLSFEYKSKNLIKINWKYPENNSTTIDVSEAILYFHGEKQTFIQKQKKFKIENDKDVIKILNNNFFKQLVIYVSKLAKLEKK